jgi:short-subunit dehydrogenase
VVSIKLKKLADQVIVITGASSGIGLTTAKAAANKGAAVVLAARSGETLEHVVREITDRGGRALAVTCDVTDRVQLARLAEEAVSEFGRIDTWVNDAGLAIYGRLDEVSDEDSRKLFEVNFWGLVNGSLTALPYLKKQGGALINLGSEVSEAAAPLLGMYTASKHAVKGFTDTLRLEIEEVDKVPVSITLIQPTAVDTPFPQHARNYQEQEAKLPTPMIDPEQVAAAILEAAETPTRSKKVGAMSVLNTNMAKLVPGLGDHLAAKQVDHQHYDEPPRNPEGTLDRASEAIGVAGSTHGGGGRTPD